MSAVQSIHSDHIREVHNVPFAVITRPVPSELDEDKVRSLMNSIASEEERGAVPPIDVLWVQKSDAASDQPRNYYFAFGGCHRYEAYKRLNRSHIPCKLIKVDESVLATHTGFTLKEA